MNDKYEIFLTEDGSHSIRIKDTKITFHSKNGAIQESKHVFIENGLQYWIQQLGHNKKSVTIFEVGFGTGLNALLTAMAAAKNSINIVYYTIDKHPLPVEVYTSLNYTDLLREHELYKTIMQKGWEQLLYISPFFKLYKSKSDLCSYKFNTSIDIIYFDAFAPEDQSDMWSEAVYKQLYLALNFGGVLVTYCSKGSVRRALANVGFMVEKLPGPPGKREVIRAIKR